jgi:hypothetical protein
MSILIQFSRVSVTSCEQDHSPKQQIFEKPLQDGGISYVIYLELI